MGEILFKRNETKRNETKRNVFLGLILLSISCTPVDEGGGVTSGSSLPTTPELTLAFPDSSNADSNTIEISASSVSIGNTIKLYSDSNCSVEVSSMVATDSSVVFSLSTLELGVHKFFASQETPSGKKSSCSEVPLTYVYENQAPNYLDSITTTSPQPTSGTSSTVEVTLSGVVYGHTITLCSDIACNNILGTVVADHTGSVTFSVSLIDHGEYEFYAQATNNFGSSSPSLVHSYSYGAAPSAPTFASSSGSGVSATPDITVSEVSSGDVVKIFSDSSCSMEMGSAASSGVSVDVTSSELSGFTTHSFYVNATNEFGTSPCSSGSFSYELLEFYPTILVADLASKRSSFVDCGASQSTISAKVAECGAVNDGATVNNNGKIWKLVTRIGEDELWMDDSTGLVWSPAQGNNDWFLAISHCSGLSAYSITGESWYLPSQAEMTTASLNGYKDFISDSGNFSWSSDANSSNDRAYLIDWNDGIWYVPFKTMSYYDFRCVFSSRD